MRDLLDFLKTYHHWFIFIFLEIISGVLLFQYNSYHGSVWLSSSNAVVGKIYEWESAVLSYMTYGKANEALTIRNFYLERQNDQLRRLYKEAVKDTSALERQELAFLNQFNPIPAKVVDNSVSKPDNLITIDKGRADGVETDMGVACGNGVVGVVSLVSDHYAVVVPVLNTEASSISCAIRNTGYFGYLHWYGEDPAVAYVEDIPRHAKFKIGDWMVTSGYSFIFPSGVLVGKIEQAYNSSDGLSFKLKVRLSTDFSCLRNVCVISDKSIAERAALLQAARDSINVVNRE